MTAKELINLLPADLLNEIGMETKVDNQVKKLKGDIVFKLLLFSMLGTDKLSLRVMEAFLASAKFSAQFNSSTRRSLHHIVSAYGFAYAVYPTWSSLHHIVSAYGFAYAVALNVAFATTKKIVCCKLFK